MSNKASLLPHDVGDKPKIYTRPTLNSVTAKKESQLAWLIAPHTRVNANHYNTETIQSILSYVL